MCWKLVTSGFVLISVTSQVLADPANDDCQHATQLSVPDSKDNQTLEGAHDDPPWNGDIPPLPEVYYVLNVTQVKRVKVCLVGKAGAKIKGPLVHVTDSPTANDPCDGVGKYRGSAVFYDPPHAVPSDLNQDGFLNEDEQLCADLECLPVGKYVITINTRPLPGAGEGGFKIIVAGSDWQNPPPGAIQPKDSGGNNRSTFTQGADRVYLGGTMTPEASNTLHVIPNQTLTNGQVIPLSVIGTAQTVNASASGLVLDSEFEGFLVAGSTPNSLPALVWGTPSIGTYTIVLDRNGDGIYNSAIDLITPGGFSVTTGAGGAPAATTWGLVAMFALIAAAGSVLIRRRQVDEFLAIPTKAGRARSSNLSP